ncbi:hypothetical protein IWX50DRAFT_621462, partial [Phyllosticta citricarpa]
MRMCVCGSPNSSSPPPLFFFFFSLSSFLPFSFRASKDRLFLVFSLLIPLLPFLLSLFVCLPVPANLPTYLPITYTPAGLSYPSFLLPFTLHSPHFYLPLMHPFTTLRLSVCLSISQSKCLSNAYSYTCIHPYIHPYMHVLYYI